MPQKTTYALLIGLLLSAFGAVASFATPTTRPTPKPTPSAVHNKPELTFKSVMILLQQQMNLAAAGIYQEDYALIQRAGYAIAKHPAPSLAERKRLVRVITPIRKQYRIVGRIVHGNAEAMARAAEKRQMPAVLTAYQQLLGGCVACHQLTRASFQATP